MAAPLARQAMLHFPVFSDYERIFANPMATAAVIDGGVSQTVILERELLVVASGFC